MFSQQVKCFVEGLYIDALRGEDATGACLVRNSGAATVIKEATEAVYFLSDEAWKTMSANAITEGKALLGHNRKATVGGYKDEQAHPFITDDEFVFFHNGSLHSWKDLGYQTEVDSDALGKHIHKTIRSDGDLGEALGKVYGAYACVWYDMVNEKVQMIRNKDRPLWLLETETCWVYCSEPEMGVLSARRNGMAVKKCEEVPVDTLVSFNLTVASGECKPKSEILTIKKAMPPATNTTGGTTTNPGTKNTRVTKGSAGRYSSFHRTKKDFKRWRAQQINEHCSFWVEDFDRVPDSGGKMWALTGTLEIDGCEGQIKIKAFKHASEDEIFYEYYDKFVMGLISDVVFNETTNEILMIVTSPTPCKTTDISNV